MPGRRRPPSSAIRTPRRPGVAQGGRPTKAERREHGRHRREEARRQTAHRRRIRLVAAALAVPAIAGVAVFALTRPRNLPGLLTARAPWPANTEQLPARLSQIHVPAAGNTLHIHSYLAIFVSGSEAIVPAGIGLGNGITAPLHTHDSTGIIHVESTVSRTFTLGELFDVWGLRLTPSCLGAYCDDGDRQLRAFVGGRPVTGDPRDIRLTDHEVIVLAFGTNAQLPNPVPSYYDFAILNPHRVQRRPPHPAVTPGGPAPSPTA